MQIQRALDRFLLQLQADGRSEHTVAQYRRHVRLLARWLATRRHKGRVEGIDDEVVAHGS